jgi:hypothetical protein
MTVRRSGKTFMLEEILRDDGQDWLKEARVAESSALREEEGAARIPEQGRHW